MFLRRLLLSLTCAITISLPLAARAGVQLQEDVGRFVFVEGEVVRFMLQREGGFPQGGASGSVTVTIHDPATNEQVDEVAGEDLLVWDAADARIVVVDSKEEADRVSRDDSAAHRVILLLDRSASMAVQTGGGKSRWEQALVAVNEITSGLGEYSVEVAVAPFDCRFVRPGEFDYQSATSWSASIDADWSSQETLCTALYNAMAEAWAEATQGAQGKNYMVVVVTDGQNDLRDAPSYQKDDNGEYIEAIDGTKMIESRKYRPWCNKALQPTQSWGWIAQPGADLAWNDGWKSSDCSKSQDEDTSYLGASETTSFDQFTATLKGASKGSPPGLAIRCFGFQGEVDAPILQDLCTSFARADDSEALRQAVIGSLKEDIAVMGVTIRLPKETLDKYAGNFKRGEDKEAKEGGKQHAVVQIKLSDDTVVGGYLPKVYSKAANSIAPSREEGERFGTGIPPVAHLLIAFIVGLGVVILIWIVVQRVLWSELEATA